MVGDWPRWGKRCGLLEQVDILLEKICEGGVLR